MARLIVRPGILDRIKDVKGIQTDAGMAALGGVSLSTSRRYREGESPVSPDFIARIGISLGYSAGELVVIVPDKGDITETDRAA